MNRTELCDHYLFVSISEALENELLNLDIEERKDLKEEILEMRDLLDSSDITRSNECLRNIY